jgi:hypothetical protein
VARVGLTLYNTDVEMAVLNGSVDRSAAVRADRNVRGRMEASAAGPHHCVVDPPGQLSTRPAGIKVLSTRPPGPPPRILQPEVAIPR